MKNIIWLLSFIFIYLRLVCKSEDVRVTTNNGPIKGSRITISNNKKVDVYKGIPFGKSTAGNMKYRYPEAVGNWTTEKDATSYGQQCPQPTASGFDAANKGSVLWFSAAGIGEDCLNLNVWSPVDTTSTKLPVMVWIFGGGYFSGAGSLDIYDGSYLAAFEEVVVVTMNYRVGLEGFLYNGTSSAPGNQGLMDQLLSLKWVNANIDKFRGDPDQVTLFGESAGAVSVALHLISKLSQPYFNRVILESSSLYGPWSVADKEEAKQRSKNAPLTNDRLKERFEALRKAGNHYVADVRYMLDVFSPPVADGYFIPANSVDELMKTDIKEYLPKNKNIDIFLGTNAHEGTFFMLYDFGLTLSNGSVAEPTDFSTRNTYPMIFKAIHEKYFPQKYIDRIANVYEIKGNNPRIPANWLDAWSKLQNLFGDSFFKCPVVKLADDISKSGGGSVYMYSFEQQTKALPFPEWTGVQHGYEVDYVFGMPYSSIYTTKYYGYTEEEKALSTQMMKMWANFAKTGNPSTESVSWPFYDANSRKYVSLKAPVSNIAVVEGGIRKKYCDLWNIELPSLYFGTDYISGSNSLSPNFMTSLTIAAAVVIELLVTKIVM